MSDGRQDPSFPRAITDAVEHADGDIIQYTARPLLCLGTVCSAVPDLIKAHAGKVDRAGYYLQREQGGVMLGKVPADGAWLAALG